MADITIPPFGRLDPDALEEYYDAELAFNNGQIQADLNFEQKTIVASKLETVKHFIENIRIHDLNNKRFIDTDFKSKEAGVVNSYLEQHLEELGENELADLIDLNSKVSDYKNQLLKMLCLVRVGIYPDNQTSFAVFDYSVGTEITDQLVVIFTDENGNIEGMSIER